MKVYYSETHRQHDAPFEVLEGGVSVPVFECPERMDRILAALATTGWAEVTPPRDFGLGPIRAVHAADYLDYLQTAYDDWQAESGQLGIETLNPVLYPATFPPRRGRGKPSSVVGRAGYYTMDLSAPIVAGTYPAAAASAQCALSAAEEVARGDRVAFALCRPPGHHAGRDYAGGYCYLNNAAIAARYLTRRGKVAVVDVDYHAGNGTQDIFYEAGDVLTISIHADPARQYPYFMGYADETGEGPGAGLHRNFPLPPGTGDAAYLRALDEALALVRAFGPESLVVSAGMDIYAGDPLGDFAVTTEGVRAIGRGLAALRLPTVVVMEGGYNNEALGENVVGLLSAFLIE